MPSSPELQVHELNECAAGIEIGKCRNAGWSDLIRRYQPRYGTIRRGAEKWAER